MTSIDGGYVFEFHRSDDLKDLVELIADYPGHVFRNARSFLTNGGQHASCRKKQDVAGPGSLRMPGG